ncbi:MAG: prepilin peptidase [Solirubrobacterales bacterium]|nr:prepilin peptidase [Solirubrobacterales bacterium]
MVPIEAIIVCLALLVGSITDLRHRLIPDLLTFPAAGAIGLVELLPGSPDGGLLSGLLTVALICLPLGALSILRPGSFGMGDVKLIAVMALAAGPAVWVPLIPGLGFATGFGLLSAARGRTGLAGKTLPLAPFLAVPGIAFFAWTGLFGQLLQ